MPLAWLKRCVVARVESSVLRPVPSRADSGASRKEIAVLISGRNMALLGGMQAPPREGDEVAIFPPMYGG
ncbi:MAG TPA: MoaD/ThiS family protein [Thermoleophilia bacterium]|nr:MoaD/ThiS family protein [Thermoleophilia bacterium]